MGSSILIQEGSFRDGGQEGQGRPRVQRRSGYLGGGGLALGAGLRRDHIFIDFPQRQNPYFILFKPFFHKEKTIVYNFIHLSMWIKPSHYPIDLTGFHPLLFLSITNYPQPYNKP